MSAVDELSEVHREVILLRRYRIRSYLISLAPGTCAPYTLPAWSEATNSASLGMNAVTSPVRAFPTRIPRSQPSPRRSPYQLGSAPVWVSHLFLAKSCNNS